MREIRHEVERAGVVAIVGSCDKRRGKSYIEQLIIGEEGQLLGEVTSGEWGGRGVMGGEWAGLLQPRP